MIACFAGRATEAMALVGTHRTEVAAGTVVETGIGLPPLGTGAVDPQEGTRKGNREDYFAREQERKKLKRDGVKIGVKRFLF